jgi:hypothetical protein
MKLYHGTTETVARLALTEGLCPRSETGADSRWEAHPSSGEHVYLTETYAGYFAMSATEGDERWGIVEVETDLLDHGDLCPDEDFLEQVSRAQTWPAGRFYDGIRACSSMEERTAWFRENLQGFAHLWEESLNHLGNVAHHGCIPVEAITRVSVYDPRSNGTVSMAAADPCIMPLNHQICGDKYRALTRWLAGYPVDPAALMGWTWQVLPEHQKQAAVEAYNDVSGITLLEAP